ncbi:MBL fold metallo-hydrolase [Streptomyces gamaensis]|uniref:MBL fold metallo-hydrolase n=1 Tax=Streptomyces gamaensis TaxID=1763542 RepID=A0ABW0YXW5_9ACTN
MTSTPGNTADTARLRRPSGIRSLRLGETKVTYVPDGATQLSARGWLPDSTEEFWAAHAEYVDADGWLAAGVGSLLVEHGDRALLIDAGFGPQHWPAEPGKPYGEIHGGRLLDNLASLGHPADRIETVAFTHLHLDHTGWASEEHFPAAAFLFGETEWEQREAALATGTTEQKLAEIAPRVRTVAEGEEFFPGVTVLPTPGHTPGHTAYVITGGGRRLIAFGDAMHTPVQVTRPEWPSAVDHDGAQAAVHRGHLVEELRKPGTIGFGNHFADVVFGRVETDGNGVVWRAVDA